MEKLKSGFEFIFSSYKRTAAILFIGALTLAIPITITLVGQQQDIRQRADTGLRVPCLIPESILAQLPKSVINGYGDVDGDRTVSTEDSSLILESIAGDVTLTLAQKEAADVNDDPNVLSSGRDVTSIDSALILQYIDGLISTFRVCSTTTPSATPTPTPTTTDTIPPTSVITSPAEGSTQTSPRFTVTVVDSDTGGSGLAQCYYAVFDQGGPGIPRTERTCNTPIEINVGPTSYGCQQTGPYCNVRISSSDNAGNEGPPDGRNFSITYTGVTPPTTTPVVTATPTPTPTTPCTIPASLGVGTRYYGDVNRDNLITQRDSDLVLAYTAGDKTFTPAQIEAADVNGRPNVLSSEEEVDSRDAALIGQYVAGLISTFRACPATTPTTTPVVTATLTPTPTGIPPGTTGLSLSITLPGIGVSQDPALGINNNPKRPQRNVEVAIFNSSNQLIGSFNSTIDYDSVTGKYKGNVNLGSNFGSGSYLVKVRFDNTLWKTIPGIQNITSGQTYTAPEATLVSGDIIQDNEINLLDYNALLSCYGTQTCATKVQADLNDDDKVDELDINILYAGFAKRVGD